MLKLEVASVTVSDRLNKVSGFNSPARQKKGESVGVKSPLKNVIALFSTRRCANVAGPSPLRMHRIGLRGS